MINTLYILSCVTALTAVINITDAVYDMGPLNRTQNIVLGITTTITSCLITMLATIA